MSSLEVFQFPATGQHIRSIVVGDTPWFVGRDVADVLGYSNSRDALATHVPAAHRKGSDSLPLTDLGLHPQTVLISEAGLYRLVMRSRTDAAEAFQEWVTADVLPTLRKTGRYEVDVVSDPLGALERQTAMTTQAIEIAKAERARAEAAEQRVAELAPDAARARRTIDAHGLALVGSVAKRFGIRERTLREFLFAEGLLIRNGSRRNEPMARYVASGHFEVKVTLVGADPDRPPVERSVTYVTPTGEALIWRRLHRAGLVSSPRMPERQLELLI